MKKKLLTNWKYQEALINSSNRETIFDFESQLKNGSNSISIDDESSTVTVREDVLIPLKDEWTFVHQIEESPLSLSDDYFIYTLDHPFHDLNFQITIPSCFRFTDLYFNPTNNDQEKGLKPNERNSVVLTRNHSGWGLNKIVCFVSWEKFKD